MIAEAVTVLNTAAESCCKRKKPSKNVPKLKVWNVAIARSLKDNREANRKWNSAGRPSEMSNALLQRKKKTKCLFRAEIRKELSNRNCQISRQIADANSSDKRQFFRLIKKQWQKGNTLINDLHVGDEVFTGDDVINGFHKHFSALAQPSDNPMYDQKFYRLYGLDYDVMKRIASKVTLRKVSV